MVLYEGEDKSKIRMSKNLAQSAYSNYHSRTSLQLAKVPAEITSVGQDSGSVLEHRPEFTFENGAVYKG